MAADRKEYLREYEQRPERKKYLQEYRRKNREKRREKLRDWNSKNPEKRREHKYKTRYGITVQDYDRMLEEQGGVCAICKTDKPRNNGDVFAVDHCHETGKVRGLLCFACNRSLGNFKDNISSLKRAIDYLKKHSLK